MNSKNNNYLFNREYTEKLLKNNTAKVINGKLIGDINANISEYLQKSANSKAAENGSVKTACFSVQYPGILVGLGYPHELSGINKENSKGQIANGFSFDYVTGMPYIPGSTIKGIISHVFGDALKNAEYIEYINSLSQRRFDNESLEAYIKEHFGGKDGRGCDIFYDAELIVDVAGSKDHKFINFENITPHPDAIKTPNPITMLKITPGTVLRIAIKTEEENFELYKQILLDMGIGAKTNVGFGVIEEIDAKKLNVEFGTSDFKKNKNVQPKNCTGEKRNNRTSMSMPDSDRQNHNVSSQICNAQIANKKNEGSEQRVIIATVSNVTKWDVWLVPDSKQGIEPSSRINDSELAKEVKEGSRINVQYLGDSKEKHNYKVVKENQ